MELIDLIIRLLLPDHDVSFVSGLNNHIAFYFFWEVNLYELMKICHKCREEKKKILYLILSREQVFFTRCGPH